METVAVVIGRRFVAASQAINDCRDQLLSLDNSQLVVIRVQLRSKHLDMHNFTGNLVHVLELNVSRKFDLKQIVPHCKKYSKHNFFQELRYQEELINCISFQMNYQS